MKNSQSFTNEKKNKTVVRAKKVSGRIVVEIDGVKIGGLSAQAELAAATKSS